MCKRINWKQVNYLGLGLPIVVNASGFVHERSDDLLSFMLKPCGERKRKRDKKGKREISRLWDLKKDDK
jgi:hypothetical protein